MKTLYYALAALLTLFSFASCTIEKRLHQPGWHVEWHKQLPVSGRDASEAKHSSSIEPIAAVRTNEAPIPEETIDAPQIIVTEENDFAASEAVSQDAAVSPAAVAYSETEPADDTIKRKVVVVNESELSKRPAGPDIGERDPLTILLWSLAVLSILLISLLAVLLLFESIPSILILVFLFSEFPFLILARAILAIFIRKREREQPDNYRHSDNVILAVLLPEIYLVFAFFMTLLVAILLYA
jgi:hypothetical protein